MTVKIAHTADVQKFFEEASGLLNQEGNPRLKTLVNRIINDVARVIEDLPVTPDEFWKAVDYLNRLGARQEAGLLVAGLGLEHYLDLQLDAQDEAAGLSGGTPRTIEGPLYVAGAPLAEGEVRMDDGLDAGTVMFLQGRVLDEHGQPVAGAVVDLWHANTQGRTPTSTAPSRTTTCVVASSPMQKAVTVRAASCRRAMAAQRTVQPRSCLTNWAAMAIAQRMCTSLSLHRVTVT